MNRGELNQAMNAETLGVILGFIFQVPASGLTGTYEGGVAKIRSPIVGRQWDEAIVQGSTKLFTASRDTYAFLVNNADGSAQSIQYIEKTNGAAQPTKSEIETAFGANYLWLASIITDGSNITAVVDRRDVDYACGKLHRIGPVEFSYVTAEQGATFNEPMPFNGKLLAMVSTVSAALGASDNGTVQAAIGRANVYNNVTGGLLTHLASATVGTRVQAIATGNRHFKRGDSLRGTAAKSTTGGRTQVTFIVEETP